MVARRRTWKRGQSWRWGHARSWRHVLPWGRGDWPWWKYVDVDGWKSRISHKDNYTKHKEPTTEKLIEDLFDEHDIYWEKTET